MEQNTKRILIFIAFAFGIPWAAALGITLSGMLAADPLQAGGLANTIFIATPWLANLAARLVTREGFGSLGLRPNLKRGWPFYLAAWWLPLVVTVVGAAAFYLAFPQSYDPNLGSLQKLVANTPSAAADPWTLLLSTALSIMIISVPINMLVSMGEEFGWRAYLLQKLVQRFTPAGADYEPAAQAAGARKAALLTGVIHGVWHWPLIVMTAGLVPGFNYLTLPFYLVLTCGMSILLSWVTLRSGSVWPAALGHGAVNAASALPGFLLLGQAIPLLGPDVTGLLGSLGYTLLALVLYFSRAAFSKGREPSPKSTRPVPAA